MDMQYVATLLRETKSTRPCVCRKMTIWGDFQCLSGVQGEGGGSKNWKIGVTSFMDGPL